MRKSGILLPVFSLPSRYGQGKFSNEAKEFILKLKAAGQSYWQILPLHPVDTANSPYKPISCFAGETGFIDPDALCAQGLITQEELDDAAARYAETRETPVDRVDYKCARAILDPLMRDAYRRFVTGLTGALRNKAVPADAEAAEKAASAKETLASFWGFCEANAGWLDDYALFSALDDKYGDSDWTKWDDPVKRRDPETLQALKKELSGEIDYRKWLQYEFSLQWDELRSFAHENGIEIIGDLPIYASLESAECWAHPELFKLNEDFVPTEVAGCPPDAFSADGQLWGNPLYRWEDAKDQVFAWWKARIDRTFSLFDKVRIDHFRGFESYFSIPAETGKPLDGHWNKGPGIEFFNFVTPGYEGKFIAEDLGYLTDDVYALVAATGFPGMKILQFAFNNGWDNYYLPHYYGNNCVVYTGTHDNDTVRGWFRTANDWERWFCMDYIRGYFRDHDEYHPVGELAKAEQPAGVFVSQYIDAEINEDNIADALIRLAAISPAETCIFPLQDVLAYGPDTRINVPAIAVGNWAWQMMPGAFTYEDAERLCEITKRAGR